jgi:hypothetical protein
MINPDTHMLPTGPTGPAPAAKTQWEHDLDDAAELKQLRDRAEAAEQRCERLLAALDLYHKASLAPEGTKLKADLSREAFLARRAVIAAEQDQQYRKSK